MNKTEQTKQRSRELSKLYLKDGKSTREIGGLFGVSKHTIEIAMKLLGIERRHTRTKGTKPDKTFLVKAVFDDHRSLMDVGKELNCDPWTVKKWFAEYGIKLPKLHGWSQRNAKRGYKRPSKKLLEKMYNEKNHSLQNIADELGVSRQAIKDAFRHYKIKLNYSGWNQKRFVCKDGHVVKSLYEQRVDDWLFDHGLDHQYEPLLPFSNKGRSDFLVGDTYIEIFGVRDSQKYDIRKKQKIELYQSHGYKLIAINYWDFSKQKMDLWKRKLIHIFNAS